MRLNDLCVAITSHPTLGSVDFATILRFLELARQLKPHISTTGPDPVIRRAETSPPTSLPLYIVQFLSASLLIKQAVVNQCWEVFSDFLWWKDSTWDASDAFFRDGLPLKLSLEEMTPPVRKCTHIECKDRHLTEAKRYEARIFTLDRGVFPVFTTSLYCRVCKTRYHLNFATQNKQRTYYPGIPDILEVDEHMFIETRLVELWVHQMVFSWTSGSSCARVYDQALGQRERFSASAAQFSLSLSGEQVWNAIALLSLLKDHNEKIYLRQEEGSTVIPFVLPNETTLDKRLKGAMEARSNSIISLGQESYAHICDLCFVVNTEGEKTTFLSAAVTDGITIGRPCCAVAHCQKPLTSNRAHFCADHRARECLCKIEGCEVESQPGRRTCDNPNHIATDVKSSERSKAMFQLKERLKKAGLVQLPPGDSTDSLDDEDASAVCPQKPDDGIKTVRARFSRRRTHNEQLIVRPCGVVVACATFFGSEPVPEVKEFLKKTFPNPETLPTVIFFNNNCQLKKHLDAQEDTYFDNCALPVDVFHFKSKHKESDNFCATHCNPANFEELFRGKEWVFNSSAAEQVNVWFGGYDAITHEMLPHRYDFFLDEMIKQRNRWVVSELGRKGKYPRHIPMSLLFPAQT